MRQHGIVHPEMLARIQPNFYPSLCTIQESTDARDTFGQQIPAWLNVSDLEDLPCRISPRNTREVRSEDQVYVDATHQVALAGYYPTIHEGMQAVVDDLPYEIEGVEWDGNQKTTRLFVRIVDRGES